MSLDKVIEAFGNGGATGLAMLAMLIVIIFLIRTVVIMSKQVIAAFERSIESNRVAADADKMLTAALSRIEAKLEVMWPGGRDRP